MISSDFQKALFLLLKNDPDMTTAVGGRIFDRAPKSAEYPYITFGPVDTIFENMDECLDLRTEAIQLDVWSSSQAGKQACKDICDLLIAVTKAYALTVGGVEVDAGDFDAGALVDLTATGLRIFDDPDGITIHGVLTLEALLDGTGG